MEGEGEGLAAKFMIKYLLRRKVYLLQIYAARISAAQ